MFFYVLELLQNCSITLFAGEGQKYSRISKFVEKLLIKIKWLLIKTFECYKTWLKLISNLIDVFFVDYLQSSTLSFYLSLSFPSKPAKPLKPLLRFDFYK